MKEGYHEPVNGVSPQELPGKMKRALEAASCELPKGTGVIVFAFDFGHGGGMAYASNAVRADAIKMLEEWIAYQRTLT